MKKPVYPKTRSSVKGSADPLQRVFRAASVHQTRALGKALAPLLLSGDVVLLEGPIGAGKTTLVQGLGRALGIRQPITSPTFVLRKRYALPRPRHGIRTLQHVDAYRLSSAAALRETLDDLAPNEESAVWCVEWGRYYAKALGAVRLWRLTFHVVNQTTRSIVLQLPHPLRRR